MLVHADAIFDGSFIDNRTYFLYRYDKVPCITWVDQVDTAKVLAYIKTEYGDVIEGIYQYSQYFPKKRRTEFATTIILLRDNCLIELDGYYCTVLHTHRDYDMANALIREMSRFKRREKKQPFEINLVIKTDKGLQLKSMEIKKTRLDVKLYYEDDFAEVDKVIRYRLGRKKDKGIVLLHGLPGTGKTTYLRYLVGRINKRVLFLSPTMANNILNADFMDLLINNPDSVLIIEDAESIIMDRRANPDSSVSNLLNISDGLMADFLNVQIICTFNHPLSMVDDALMRKGRLIAKYEFGKLNVSKAQKLSEHLGFDTAISRPMTIAEIAHQGEKEYSLPRTEIIGFRRHLATN